MACKEICLNCKHAEFSNCGFNGFIGEDIVSCKICEEENENKNECFESEDSND